MKNVVIVDGIRTPFGKLGGGLRQFHTAELCGLAIRALTEKTQIQTRGKIDCVFMGSAFGDAQSTDIARYALLYAGLPYDVTASFVEMQCGSAIDALNHAAWKIATGNADVIIAGGGESYSRRCAKFSMSVEPYKLIPPTAIPNRLSPNPDEATDMITNADLIAREWNVTREECDAYALRSQLLAQNAIESGWAGRQIAPVVIPATNKTEEIIVSADEHPRKNMTLEQLTRLRSINDGGVTTAGNSSGRNDGASAILMMSEDMARQLGYKPLARWLGSAEYGVKPQYMSIAPAYSNTALLKRFGLGLNDISVYECNEAFASQNLAVIRAMEQELGGTVPMDRWNPNGGAIAFGHPNGASGTRIAMFAMQHLQDTQGRYGLISSCCGGGQGVSTLIERP